MTGPQKIIRYLTAHPTAANLLMFFFMLLGLLTISQLRRETFPDFASTEVSVTAVYPGATAAEVESAICQKIEDAIDDVADIAEVQSEARENQASVTVKMKEGADAALFLNDIKTEVEAINDFPEEVEDVVVKSLNRTDQVLSIAVTGPMSVIDLKKYCESLKDRLKQLDLISQVTLLGFSNHQLLVEIPFSSLMSLGISITDVANATKNQDFDLPSGTLESSRQDRVVRFTEERHTRRELANLTVIAAPGGAEIRLGDIAKITERFESKENKILFNGKRAGILQINKTKKEDALRILDAVKAFLVTERRLAPPSVKFVITQNVSQIVRERLQLLVLNGTEGLVLVFLSMWLFFTFRFSFWVAMGLPVSFLFTLFIMKQINFSLNMLSMVGLLIATGLLMDDAIVIAENVAAQIEKGKTHLDAVVEGLSEVAPGVFSSFLTTCFIFGTLAVFMKGEIGKVLYAIPVVLIITLSVSLIEAFCILPNHLSHSLSGMGNKQRSRFHQSFERGLNRFKEGVLGWLVDLIIEWRYLFLGLVVMAFIVAISLIPGGRLKIIAFPETDGDVLQARILLPQGTPLTHTSAVVKHMVGALKTLDREMTPHQPDQKALVQNYSVTFGSNPDAKENGAHVATISVDLLGAEHRNAGIDEITHRWRELTGDIPDIINITYKEPSIGPGGLPIEMRLKGQDLHQLKQASAELMNWLNTYDGVFDLSDDLRPGKPEVIVKLLKGAMAKGLNARDIATQLRNAVQGVNVNDIQSRYGSISVDVRLLEKDRATIDDLNQFHIITREGTRIPLLSVADVSYSRGYGRINRINGIRTVTVTGDINAQDANANEIVNDTIKKFIPGLKKKFPEVTVSLEGQKKETQKSMQSMGMAFIIGIFGVYALLSIQFKSYIEPLLVMLAIPFALIGVISGHLLMGLNFSMPSIMGFISLAGIVVNDSILLVSFIKGHLQNGEDAISASKKASLDRFRAVLLTSVTTIMGLLPLLSERSLQAQMLIPLACSIVFGLLASTLLVLLVIPVLYAILDDLKGTGNV